MAAYGHGSSQARWDSQSLSFTIGWLAGIRLRLHLIFVLFLVFELLRGLGESGPAWTFKYLLPVQLLLFGIVFLHELGHCFGCRAVGGRADDVLLWPLGGLAYCDPPHRPLENLITTLAGPAVNVVLLLLLTPPLLLLNALSADLWNPFVFWAGMPVGGVALYLALAWKLSYWLLLFNALPIFPLDGGRVLQELFWFRLGFYTATMIATAAGAVGAFLLFSVSLYAAGSISRDYFMLTAIAVFGFLDCLRMRKELEHGRQFAESELGYDFSAGYTSLDHSTGKIRERKVRPSLLARFRHWLERRRQLHEARLESELDRLLDKIHRAGIDSLSRSERRTLSQASKRLRR